MKEEYKRFVVVFSKNARDEFNRNCKKSEGLEGYITHKCQTAFTAIISPSWLSRKIEFSPDPSIKINPDTTNLAVTFIASQDTLDLRKRRCHPWPIKSEEVFIRDRLNEYFGLIYNRSVIYVRNVHPE